MHLNTSSFEHAPFQLFGLFCFAHKDLVPKISLTNKERQLQRVPDVFSRDANYIILAGDCGTWRPAYPIAQHVIVIDETLNTRVLRAL